MDTTTSSSFVEKHAHALSRESASLIFQELRSTEQKDRDIPRSIISMTNVEHIQNTLAQEMHDNALSIRGYVALEARMIENLQNRGESIVNIQKMPRKTHDIDLLSKKEGFTLDAVEEDPSITNVVHPTAHMLLLKYGGIQVQIGNNPLFTPEYCIPTSWVIKNATEVKLGSFSKHKIKLKVIAAEDIVIGKLASSRNDGNGLPPVHTLDLLMFAHSGNRCAYDFLMSMREGFQERARVSRVDTWTKGKTQKNADILWRDLRNATRKLSEWPLWVRNSTRARLETKARDLTKPAEYRARYVEALELLQRDPQVIRKLSQPCDNGKQRMLSHLIEKAKQSIMRDGRGVFEIPENSLFNIARDDSLPSAVNEWAEEELAEIKSSNK